MNKELASLTLIPKLQSRFLKATQKPLLTELPFERYFYNGANNKSYWSSFHMLSVQVEDFVDCLQSCILSTSLLCVFLFNYRKGHT